MAKPKHNPERSSWKGKSHKQFGKRVKQLRDDQARALEITEQREPLESDWIVCFGTDEDGRPQYAADAGLLSFTRSIDRAHGFDDEAVARTARATTLPEYAVKAIAKRSTLRSAVKDRR